eukprot:scaffold87294_cov57-Attheya_sp.AAC.2
MVLVNQNPNKSNDGSDLDGMDETMMQITLSCDTEIVLDANGQMFIICSFAYAWSVTLQGGTGTYIHVGPTVRSSSHSIHRLMCSCPRPLSRTFH